MSDRQKSHQLMRPRSPLCSSWRCYRRCHPEKKNIEGLGRIYMAQLEQMLGFRCVQRTHVHLLLEPLYIVCFGK